MNIKTMMVTAVCCLAASVLACSQATKDPARGPGITHAGTNADKIEERTETQEITVKTRYAVHVLDTSKCDILRVDAPQYIRTSGGQWAETGTGAIVSTGITSTGIDAGVHDEYGRDVKVTCLMMVKP